MTEQNVITEHYTVGYEASIRLTEKHIVALDKVLAYGAEAQAKAMVSVLPEREHKAVEPNLLDLLKSLRRELPELVRKGQDARAVFSGLADAVRKPQAGQSL